MGVEVSVIKSVPVSEARFSYSGVQEYILHRHIIVEGRSKSRKLLKVISCFVVDGWPQGLYCQVNRLW